MRKIAVIGPSADDPEALLGNYNGFSEKHVAPLEGIERQFAGKAEVRYALGANYTTIRRRCSPPPRWRRPPAKDMACSPSTSKTPTCRAVRNCARGTAALPAARGRRPRHPQTPLLGALDRHAASDRDRPVRLHAARPGPHRATPFPG